MTQAVTLRALLDDVPSYQAGRLAIRASRQPRSCAVAHEHVAAAPRKTAVTFGVNAIAEAAAVASLNVERTTSHRNV